MHLNNSEFLSISTKQTFKLRSLKHGKQSKTNNSASSQKSQKMISNTQQKPKNKNNCNRSKK